MRAGRPQRRRPKGLWVPSTLVTLIVAACSVGNDSSPGTGVAPAGVTKVTDPSAIGAADFCAAPGAPCSAGEGDCDSNGECQVGLRCATDVGARFAMEGVSDVCVALHCVDGVLTAGTDETGVDCGAAGSSCGACDSCLPAAENGASRFCSALCPCSGGQGDCENDAECRPGLVCSADVGPRFGLGGVVDVCVPPHCTDGVLTSDTDETGVDCGSARSSCGACGCLDPLANGLTSFCSSLCPCSAGQGDCDSDAECQPGLVCSKDVGPRFRMSGTADVCVPAHCADGVLTAETDETGVDCGADGSSCGACDCCPDAARNGTATFCSSLCPCGAGEGDCDGQAECQPGLACHTDVGPAFGMGPTFDVCVPPGSVAKNVIVFIGDGMGFEQLLAARAFESGDTAPLALETLPRSARCTTANAAGAVTDSAAAATAIATGHKVTNGRLSLDARGNELETVLELCKARGQATGLVTIHDPIVGATPAGFGAHAASRTLTTEIASDLRTGSKPNLLVGGPDPAVVQAEFEAAGYRFVTTREEFMALDGGAPFVTAALEHSAVTLPERTAVALRLLEGSPAGFFLMIEQANTDKGGHANNLDMVVQAVLELDAAVEVALSWAAARDDTLLVVTSDHETGGLDCTLDAAHPAVAGASPNCTFSATSHTDARVPVFAQGRAAADVEGTLDNTELYRLLAGLGPAR